MPAPVIADCLNYNLRFTRGVEDIGVLLTRDDDITELRSVNGPNYGRVYDADVVDALVDSFRRRRLPANGGCRASSATR